MAVTDTGIGMTPEQVGRSVPGIHAGGRFDHAQVRRYRTRARHQPAFLPDDGRRHHGRERGRARVDIHYPSSRRSAGRADRSRLPGVHRLAKAPVAASPIVLVVDDDPTVREVTERFLTREGFSVVTAGGGREGLRLTRELHPAAITLDVMMPDLDGWTVLAAIKGDPDSGGHTRHPHDDHGREEPRLFRSARPTTW